MSLMQRYPVSGGYLVLCQDPETGEVTEEGFEAPDPEDYELEPPEPDDEVEEAESEEPQSDVTPLRAVTAVRSDPQDETGPPRETSMRGDLGNQERLVALYGRVFRYIPAWDKWIYYNGKRWVLDPKGVRIRHYAKETARVLLAEAGKRLVFAEMTGPNKLIIESRSQLAWAVTSQSSAHINAMVGLAQSEPSISLDHETLDGDQWLLNVRNGTLDLRTLELRPHNPEDYLTGYAPVDYDPTAKAPKFQNFLSTIQPTEDVRKFLSGFLDTASRGTRASVPSLSSGVVGSTANRYCSG